MALGSLGLCRSWWAPNSGLGFHRSPCPSAGVLEAVGVPGSGSLGSPEAEVEVPLPPNPALSRHHTANDEDDSIACALPEGGHWSVRLVQD